MYPSRHDFIIQRRKLDVDHQPHTLHLGGGATSNLKSATLGQQLIDLQKAKDSGAISDQDYQAQKSKLLYGK